MAQIFPLEKILTVSAEDYCISAGTKLSNYDLIGIHTDDGIDLFRAQLIKSFQEIVPFDAVVVVGFNYAVSRVDQYASGTALVPKELHKSHI